MAVIFSELLDSIRAASRADKETLAQLLIDNNILLRQTQKTAQQTASDSRRTAAQTFITDTIEPQIIAPSGNYSAQHTQVLANLKIITDAISAATDDETRNELKIRLATEQSRFNAIRLQHSAGTLR